MPDQNSSEGEQPVPQRVGRHRRAPRRRTRFTAKKVGAVIRNVDLLVRIGSLITHEAPPKEWFHYLTGLVGQVVDALGSWLG